MTYKLGSLFDGSGGFPLAGSLCGIEPVWASEVEPYPVAVTRSRFPKMKHLGDISKINGAEVEPVDIITFGSPCQDLSVAGKRAGLKHEANGDEETTRSGLFMEAVRIIKEMRGATNGKYPKLACWENVPGTFSSNKGEDFRIVLEELIKIVEPSAVMPSVPQKGWAYADNYCGDGWSLAYRVFDAQYWGVPQRRRRIHLVLDLRGERAREVLFEREGVRGYFAESGAPWEATSRNAENSTHTDDCKGEIRNLNKGDVQSKAVLDPSGIAPALYAGECRGGGGECYVLDKEAVPYTLKIRSGCEGGGKGALVQEDKSATLAANNEQYLFRPIEVEAIPAVIYGISSYHSNAMKSSNPHNGIYEAKTSRTLDLNGGNPSCNQGGIVVLEPASFYPQMKAESQCYRQDGISNTLVNGTNPGYQNGVVVIEPSCDTAYQRTCGALCARDYKGVGSQYVSEDKLVIAPTVRYIVRRLTPTECARLQGFADRWGDIDAKEDFTDEEYLFWLEVRNTHAAINGKATKEYTKQQMLTWYNKLHTDSAEYKMWGNGIALPPALYCMQGIRAVLDRRDGDK